MKGKWKNILMWNLVIILLLSVCFSGQPASAYSKTGKENPPQQGFQFGEAVDLGEGPLASQAMGATIGDDEVYFANNGSPAIFYAIDSESGEVNFKQSLPGQDVIWAITIGSDGNVYFAGTAGGNLYRYDPAAKAIEDLGDNTTGDKWIWEVEASIDGKIYGATYPNAKSFEYDIASGTFKDLGRMNMTEQYTRGIGVTEDALYAGTGSKAYLYRIDRKTYEKTEIPTPVTGTDTMISNIWEYGDRLFVVNGTSLHVLDSFNHTLIRTIHYQDAVSTDGFISAPSPLDTDIMYFKNKNTHQLWTYNIQKDEIAIVGDGIDLPSTSTRTMKWVERDGEQQLAMMYTRNELVFFNPRTGEHDVIYPDVEMTGLDIQALESDASGEKLYLSGYQGSIAIYDTKKQAFTLQERDPHQIEGFGFLNNKVYMGAYGGARIYVYDPKKDYLFTRNNETNNPKLIYSVPTQQSRPFTFASGDNHLFTGTISDYGKLGGSFAAYDAKRKKWSSIENIIENQSIIGLAYKKGKVYGGSAIYGGLGINPTETTAKMFEYDVKKKKVKQFPLKLKGLKNPQMIGELSFGPDGLLWGIAWGQDRDDRNAYTLFAMDEKRKRIMKEKTVFHDLAKGSNWRPFYIRWGKDGMMYTTIGRKLSVFNPKTMNHKVLVEGTVNLMDLDRKGNVYYAKGSRLYMLPVLPAKPKRENRKEAMEVEGGNRPE